MKTPIRAMAAGLGMAVLVAAQAQVLGSPLGAPAAPSSGQAQAPAPQPVPHGQGAGVHSPLSPYAPLKPRADVVAWSTLTDIRTTLDKRRIVPVYPPQVLALDGRKLRVQGFMMPLEPGERQRHFLLSSVPLTCAFCLPGGPESMVEVRTRQPVPYSMNAVVVEGVFHVLSADPSGLYYRMSGAAAVR